MLRFINIVLVCAIVGVAVWLYELKYSVRASKEEIAALKGEIAVAKDDIILLRAEWSHLARPQRLQELAQRHLELEHVKPSQIIRERDISTVVPEREAPEPLYPGDDPIAGLLRIDQ